MLFQIHHATRYRYSAPVSESLIEVFLQPLTESRQRCLSFELTTQPSAAIASRVDYLGNTAHFFDIPGQHQRLTISATTKVEVDPPAALPTALSPTLWDAFDALRHEDALWDFLHPSARTQPTEMLRAFADEIGMARRADPLTLLHELNSTIYRAFAYAPNATEVDSPIDHALSARRGVCQDFAHVFIALARGLGIPARYVSGYLFYRRDNPDRSLPDATHAWVDAYIPSLGWIGFDPTNNILAGQRHIRVAIGRDYDDIPPTRGVFKGAADSDLDVAVDIMMVDGLPVEESYVRSGWTPASYSADEEQQASQSQQ